MPALEDGDKYYIRKEYAETSKLGDGEVNATSHKEGEGEDATNQGEGVSSASADANQTGQQKD